MKLHFKQHRQGLPCSLIEFLRQFWTIDALNPVEFLGGFLCFIRLQMSNEVPRQRYVGESRRFAKAS